MADLTHRQARKLVQGALDRPLPAKQQTRLDAHLAACSACRQYVDQVRGLEGDLRRAMQERWGKQAGSISPKTIQANSRRYRMRKTILNTAKALGAIAAVAALFFLANTLLRPPGTPDAGEAATNTATTLPENTTEEMAGAWIAATDFGQITFTVDATGAWVTRMDYQFSGWTCGSNTFTLSEVMDNGYWPITDGAFTASPRSDLNVTTIMTIRGTYDTASQIFSGTWEEYAGGTRCAGDWEAARAPAATNADRAGEWTATTDFGRLVFTVNITGTRIGRTRLEFDPGWTCGSETDFDSFVISRHQRIPEDENTAFGWTWPVDDFGGVHITVIWVFNPTSRIFFGRWEVPTRTDVCRGDWVAALSNRASEYEVQAGDTCNSIAVAFYISKERLIEENNLAADCSDLYVGQTLRIPTQTP